MKTIEIKRVSAEEIFSAPNAQALMDEYEAESAVPLLGKVNPQASTYAKLEASGLFHCFGVYAGAELVGFACLLIAVYPHFNEWNASTESMFVTATYRGATWSQLKAALKAYARLHHCKAIQYTAPVNSQLAMLLLSSKSCACTNVTFTESLV